METARTATDRISFVALAVVLALSNVLFFTQVMSYVS
jgi:hypothetical protein